MTKFLRVFSRLWLLAWTRLSNSKTKWFRNMLALLVFSLLLYIWKDMDCEGDECDDDSACSVNGVCTEKGICQCTVTWAGRNCTDQNHLYFHSFSLVFYALMTVSMVQLVLCIRAEYQRQKKKSMFKACRITVQKFLYGITSTPFFN